MPRFSLLLLLLAGASLSACQTAAAAALPTPACPVSTPVVDTPPDDPNADPFGDGPWFITADRRLWAYWGSGWQAGPDGNKIIWIRPAGAQLEVTGRRLDGPADPLRAWVPDGYGTGFQVTAVYVPAAGCWEVTAEAGQSELRFTVMVAADAAP